ncbi:MAG: ISAs1 family transposase, partial [Rubripirellula sp.]
PKALPPYAKRKASEVRRTATTLEKNRGRVERRTLTTTTVGTDTCNWPGLRQFLRLERETTIKGETKTTVAYAVTSRSVESSTAEELLTLWRDRWAIENRLFWVKDATLREDHSRIRSGKAAFAMSIIRNASVNYIRSSGHQCVAAALRANALRIPALLTRLGIFI